MRCIVGNVPVARFALSNAKVLFFVTLVLSVLGLRAYATTPQSIFPPMSFSKIDVVVEAGDLPPARVRSSVTLPLETSFEQLPGVSKVQSNSSQGSAEFLISFDSATNPQSDLQLVDGRIAQVRAGLTAVTNVTAIVVTPNSEPVLSYALTSASLSQAVMRDIARFAILPKLYGVPGLARVLVIGGPTIEYHVDLEPGALAVAGLSATNVSQAIADANAVQAVGTRRQYDQRYAVVVDSSLRGVRSIEAIGVPGKTVTPVSALGTVTLGVAPQTSQASYNGSHAVIINAYPAAGADTVKMARELETRMAAITPSVPRSVAIHRYWDQTTLVVASQSSLRDSIVIGAILAVIVIYLFLRDLRLTLVAAAIIPIAMAIAVFGIELTHQTLNLMSVGGLAVAVGLIIDDAIVVIENISRIRQEHPDLSPRAAIEHAMSELALPMTASTAATVVVFLPLGLLTGVTGFFFRALATTLATSLVVSLLLALFVAPNVALALFAAPKHEREGGLIAATLGRYAGLLRWTLYHRTIVFIASGAILVATYAMLTSLPSNFLPKMDEGQFEIGYALPTGTDLPASDQAATMMENVVRADPAVASVGALTGIDVNGYSPTPQDHGLLDVSLVPPGGRASYDVVSTRLRERLQAAIPSATLDFHQILEDLINGLSGQPAPLEIAIFGPDQTTLLALATDVSARLGKIPGVVDAQSGIVYTSPTLRLRPSDARLASLGVTPSDFGSDVGAATGGLVATSIAGTTEQYPVRVSVTQSQARAFGSTALLASGVPTSVGELATVSPLRLASEQNAENGQPVQRVIANLGNRSLSAVVTDVKAMIAKYPPPPGYTEIIGGQYAIQQSSFKEFASVIVVAVALVFAVMLATFRSFRLPLVILSAIPLALIGVAIALVLTRTPFNVSSFMGLLLLVGVVVKNGILLIDVANYRRRAGASVEDALVAAGRTRLRPIVMTTLAAIGGLVPLAFGIGQGSEMEKPLAIAVIGGLATATIFTLVIIPVFYAFAMGVDRPIVAEVRA